MRLRIAASLLAAALLVPSAALAVSAALNAEANATFLSTNARKPGVQVMRDGLQYRVLKPGFGNRPKPGDMVTVYYSLSLINGEKVQGTEEDFPAQFPVNELIAGWREALQNMREGDHWQLFVPSNLGYGPAGAADGSIPPNQTLIFDIQLVKTETPPEKPKKDDDQQ